MNAELSKQNYKHEFGWKLLFDTPTQVAAPVNEIT